MKLFYLASLCLFLTFLSNAQELNLQERWFQPDGTVEAVLEDPINNKIYIGGTFTSIAAENPYGAGVSIQGNGSAIPGYDAPDGDIFSCISDGFGGWYIAGNFDSIGDSARINIAHLDALGKVTDWKIESPTNFGAINKLILQGNTLYVGGGFASIGGISRRGVAAIDITAQSILPWNPDVQGTVNDMVISGDTLYVGGTISAIGGNPRSRLGAIDLSTGIVTSWDPGANNAVVALAAIDSTILAGGWFTTCGGTTRNYMAALNKKTGVPTAWAPNFNQRIEDIIVKNDTIYFAGLFSSINSTSRNRLASMIYNTSTLTNFNPSVNSVVTDISLQNDTIYFVGNFTSVGGQLRNRVASANVLTSSVTAFDPNVNNSMFCIATNDSVAYIGGVFTTINGVARQNFAVLDGTTGQPTAFVADADNTVKSITLDDNNIYVAGFFSNIQGNSRDYLAAFNRSTETITSLAPSISGVIYSLEAIGDTLYLGGAMSTINGQSLNGLAALNSTNGTLHSWFPNPAGVIKDIELYNNTLYVGGEFSSISGFGYSNLAAFDHSSLTIIPWSPNPNEEVNTIDVRKTNVYIGGEFTEVNGVVRNRLAAFDLPSRKLSDWNPDANNIVYDVKINGGYVYATGAFDTVSSQERNHVATFNGVTGALSNWNPNLYIPGITFDAALNNVYLGGAFTKVNGKNRNKFAAFTVDEPPVIDSVFEQFGCQDEVKTVNIILSDEFPNTASLTVTSSNQTLVPNGNISSAGSNGDLYIDFNPAATEIGTTTIKLLATDQSGKKDSMEFDLTFIAPYLFHDTSYICSGDSLLIFGSYEDTAGVYYDSLVSFAGCDSIIKKTLILHTSPTPPTIAASGATTFCFGDSVTLSVPVVSDISYCWVNKQEANQYTLSNDTTGISCLGNSTMLKLYASDTISMLITDTNTCSVLSTNTITVTVHSTPIITIDSSFDLSCYESMDGRAYITVTDTNNNLTYDWSNDGTGDADDSEDLLNLDSNKYYILVENDRGCSAQDSVLIHQPVEIRSNQTITLCAGDSLIAGTNTYKTTGIYYDTVLASNGCDSIVTSDLTVLDLKTDTIDQTICFEDSIVVNGTTYNYNNPTGAEVFTNVGPYNCDSTVIINLNVLAQKIDTINQTICFEDSIVVNGTTYKFNNPTGKEVFTNVGSHNCDSTVMINLQVLDQKIDTIDQTICFEDSIVVNGTTYNYNNPTGTEVFTNVGPFNCDSTVMINLQVLDRKIDTIDQTICFEDSIVVNGTTYNYNNPTGMEVFTNVGPFNCDSTVVINLQVLERKIDTIDQTICFGDSIVVNGTTYNSNNLTGTEFLTNVGPYGCDSTVYINLQVLDRKIDTIEQSICFEDSIIINGTTYNASNPTGIEVISNVGPLNCDSTVVINLTILDRITNTLNQTICSGDTIIVNGTAYHASNLTGTEVFNGAGLNMCDSTVFIQLTLDNSLSTTISFSNDTLSLLESYDSYQWIDCDNGNDTISGATNQSFIISSSGNYAVIVTSNNCVDTSTCFSATSSSVENNQLRNFTLYPNPVHDQVTVLFNDQVKESYTITILNSIGKTIKQVKSNDQEITVDVSELSNAIYFMRIDSLEGSKTIKFIKR